MTSAKPTVTTDGPRRVGRPRAAPSRQIGVGGREQILDAAGRMFSEQGYGAASTRKIAMAVGVKQASLYYHFDCKEDILAGLLTGTVEPSLEFADKLARTEEPAHIQLYALTYFDVSLLCSARWNVGALYHLPELRADRFAPFRQHRQLLRAAYGQRITDGTREGVFEADSLESATSLVFALAESGIAMRSDDLEIDDNLPELTAASVLRLLRCGEKALAAAASACEGLQP